MRGRLLRSLPLERKRSLVNALRPLLFTSEQGDDGHAHHVVDVSPEDLRKLLSRNHFAPWDVFSYYYKHPEFGGEVVNVRRMESLDDDGIWWQTHVRIAEHPAGAIVWPHYEKASLAHPRAHIEQKGMEISLGLQTMEEEIYPQKDIEILKRSWSDDD